MLWITLAAAAGVALVALAAFLLVSSRLAASSPLSLRLTMTAVVLGGGQYVAGAALLMAGAFGRAAFLVLVAGAIVAIARLGRGGALRARLVEDARAARAAWREIAGTGRAAPAVACLLAALAGLQALRGLWLPPLDWDFLTYHGPRAVFWVQEGALEPSFDAVGAWQDYRLTPIAGDLLSAWAMVLPRDEGLVAATWAAVWAALALAAYTAARAAGGGRANSALAGAVAGFTPAGFHHMTSGYVDNFVAAGVVAGAGLLLAGARGDARPEAEGDRSVALRSGPATGGDRWVALHLGLGALAVATAAKITAAPFLALGVVLYVVATTRTARWRARIWIPPLVGWGLVAVSWMAWTWWKAGNPLFPFPVEVPRLGVRWPAPQLDPSETWTSMRPLDYGGAIVAFFWKGFLGSPALHNGMGLGGGVLVAAGAVATLARRAMPRALAIWVWVGLGVGAWLLGRVLAPGLDDARYVLAIPVLCAVALAAAPRRFARVALGLGLAGLVPYALPGWRWFLLDFLLAAACLAVGALGGGAVWLGARRRRGGGPGRSASAAGAWAAAGILAGLCALAARPAVRWWYYEVAATSRVMNSGPIFFSPSAQAHPLWRALHELPAARLAVTAGPSPRRTHWFLQPLFGAGLRHRLVYVRSPGSSWAAESALAPGESAEAQAAAWIAALERARVDAVFVYPPAPRELLWMEANPGRFEPMLPETPSLGRLYRVSAGGASAGSGAASAPGGGVIR